MRLPERLEETLSFLRSRFGPPPVIGLVLGSGLGPFASKILASQSARYAEIPSFPISTVKGHAGHLVCGTVGGVRVACLQGRAHLYEGWSAAEAAFPARALAAWGAKVLVLTNAAGGIREGLSVGQLMLLVDHLNLTGQNPLVGPNFESLGPRFPSMNDAYDPALRAVVLRVAEDLGIDLAQGVYAALRGPTYETPAEIRMLRIMGADAVGMSTVPETIVARHMGARVVGLSCVTNLAAGLAETPPNHAEVVEAGAMAAANFAKLVEMMVPELAKVIARGAPCD